MRLRFAILLVVAGAQFATGAWAQDDASIEKANHAAHAGDSKSEPKYDQTFSGPIVEMGKPAEKRTFSIKPDTRIEGKLKVRVKVTVGYVTTDDGDVARLVVVRSSQKPSEKKQQP